MLIDDDLCPRRKLYLKHAGTDHRVVEIGTGLVKAGLDPPQCLIGKRIEFSIIHPVLTFPISVSPVMRQLLTPTVLLSLLALGACGTRGPLTLPPLQTKPPTQATLDAQASKPSTSLNDSNIPKGTPR